MMKGNDGIKSYVNLAWACSNLRLYSSSKKFVGMYVDQHIQETIAGNTIADVVATILNMTEGSGIVNLSFCYEKDSLSKKQKSKLNQMLAIKDPDVDTIILTKYLSLLYSHNNNN